MPGSEPATHPPEPPDRTAAAGVDVEAARWWLLRRDGALGDEGGARMREFHDWLTADGSHAAAWNAVLRTARALDDLPDAESHALRAVARASSRRERAGAGNASVSTRRAEPTKRSAGEAAQRSRLDTEPARASIGAALSSSESPSLSRRRIALQSASALALLAVAGGAAWWTVDDHLRQPLHDQVYATPRGQRQDVLLPDGSRLILDTATRLQVRLYRGRREVLLSRGQAMFAVTADAARPFTVDAARTRVTVVGTRFQVRHVGDGVGIEVEEGQVRVEQLMASAPTAPRAANAVLLTAGTAVAADAAGRFSGVEAVNPAAIAAWRSGRLVFDDTPLADALAEFARYGDTGLAVRDPAVASMRLTGSYEIAKVHDFALALPRVLPVRLQARGTQTEVVAR